MRVLRDPMLMAELVRDAVGLEQSMLCLVEPSEVAQDLPE